jgi:dUTP pyrophosphatase
MSDVRIRYRGPYDLQKAHSHDACFDVYPNLPYPIVLIPGEVYKVPTGLFLDIPPGWAGLIQERSGFPNKGLTIHLLGGVIDAGYRGEVIVFVTNSGDLTFSIDNNHAIAQLRIVRVPEVTMVRLADEQFSQLPRTERDVKGFGSSNAKLKA